MGITREWMAGIGRGWLAWNGRADWAVWLVGGGAGGGWVAAMQGTSRLGGINAAPHGKSRIKAPRLDSAPRADGINQPSYSGCFYAVRVVEGPREKPFSSSHISSVLLVG